MTLSNQTALSDTWIPSWALFPSLEWDRGETGREAEWKSEIRGDERGNISLAWSKIQLPERHASLTSTYLCRTRGKKRQFMDGEKEAEISWSEKFRNVLCIKVSGLSGTRSAMTWLAVSLRLRRLIGCGTFRSVTHLNLHSQWCRLVKLYLTSRDSWNVINSLQNHFLKLEMWMFYWKIGTVHQYFRSTFWILVNFITLSATVYGLIIITSLLYRLQLKVQTHTFSLFRL